MYTNQTKSIPCTRELEVLMVYVFPRPGGLVLIRIGSVQRQIPVPPLVNNVTKLIKVTHVSH